MKENTTVSTDTVGTEAIVNPMAEEAVVRLAATMFNDVAYMDAAAMRLNVEKASSGGMSKKDRSIRAELGNYLLARFSLLVMGLVANADFRRMVSDAVTMERNLDDEPEDFVKEVRADMSHGVRAGKSKGNYVIDLGKYNDGLYKTLAGRISASMEKGAEFEDEMAEYAEKLTDDEKSEIGYIVSNFMYLFRAFAQNPMFTGCVKSTFKDVQEFLGLSF